MMRFIAAWICLAAALRTAPNGERKCIFAKNDVILDCSNTLYDTKTARVSEDRRFQV